MKRVIVISPYTDDISTSLAYNKQCLRDSLFKGEAPISPRLLYTLQDVLNINTPGERAIGTAVRHAWIVVANLLAVYTDLGMTPGMWSAIHRAIMEEIQIEYRKIEI